MICRLAALLAVAFTGCTAPCLPFARQSEEVRCADDGGLIATFNARNNSVLQPSCSASLDGGVVVATVSGVVCPGEQFERLANMLELPCPLPSLEPGIVEVNDGQVSLVTPDDGGVTTCRAN